MQPAWAWQPSCAAFSSSLGGGYLACQTQFLASRTSSTSETASLETPEEDPTALDEAAAPAEACSPQMALRWKIMSS
ncbi:hypothetical protein WJX84_005696 [Apatococcus fuscideae]|uniref:Secreted protein n=1 Tax=Apatococcus fuscideae TaxID=2026836 RepID=A0AAW1T9D7_9CHLO